MNDSNDKTIIQKRTQPAPSDRTVIAGAGASERTVIVPRPGGRATEQSATPPPTPQQQHTRNLSGLSDMVLPTELLDNHFSRNPLINSAATLLAVMASLRALVTHHNPAALQRQLVEEVRQFEQQARALDSKPAQIVTARYALCTALDEAVMNTPWGAKAGWSEHSLLSLFHNETFGGEKFFLILNKLLESPREHLDTLELIYLILSIGFEGKYKLDPRGKEKLAIMREQLYGTIEQQRGPFDADLSPHCASPVQTKRGVTHYVPLWVISCCFATLLLLAFSGARFWLHQTTKPSTQALNALSHSISQEYAGATETLPPTRPAG